MNEVKRKPYLANPKYIGNIVEDFYDGATRIVFCDDYCCEKNNAQEIINAISLFVVNNISLFTNI